MLDVSAAIQILLQKEKMDQYGTVLKNASWVIAPDIFVAELSNALWKYRSAGLVAQEDCAQLVEDGLGLVDDFIPALDLWKEALGEGVRNRHSVYDMLYLVTARRNDAVLITNDGGLADVAAAQQVATLV